jgi:hypothetical protein
MKKILASSILFLAWLWPLHAVAEQWLCTEDNATGFSFKMGVWGVQTFTSGRIYIVRPLLMNEKDGFLIKEDSTYGVYEQGSSYPFIGCTDSFSLIEGNPLNQKMPSGYLYCKSQIRGFSFNKWNLRFTQVYNSGYVNVVPGVNDITDQSSNTPFISIGRCAKL